MAARKKGSSRSASAGSRSRGKAPAKKDEEQTVSQGEGSADEASSEETAQPEIDSELDRVFQLADELNEAEIEQEAQEKASSWVTFRVAEEIYALPVARVQEVIKVGPVTPVPHTPVSVRGVTNLRGRVLTVVDLRIRFGLAENALSEHHRILVSLTSSGPVGLLVDSVSQMIAVRPSEVVPPPDDAATDDAITGVVSQRDELTSLLSLEALLQSLTAAASASHGA
ncbi:MAG: chemotaxis protein CheW [Acidobacteriota bacterium]